MDLVNYDTLAFLDIIDKRNPDNKGVIFLNTVWPKETTQYLERKPIQIGISIVIPITILARLLM